MAEFSINLRGTKLIGETQDFPGPISIWHVWVLDNPGFRLMHESYNAGLQCQFWTATQGEWLTIEGENKLILIRMITFDYDQYFNFESLRQFRSFIPLFC